MNSVLLLEDEVLTRKIVGDALEQSCDVTAVATIAEARRALQGRSFDLIVLDVQLPDGSGFSFFAELHDQLRHETPPVFFLTSRLSDNDKILAFSLGADDYITKPFSVSELRARIESRLKKINSGKHRDQTWSGGGVRLNLSRVSVHLEPPNARPVPLDLSPIEFKILWHLVQHEERVLSRRQLIDEVWGESIRIVERTIDVHISNIRKKIHASSLRIEAVAGSGYTLRIKAAA